MSKFDRNRTKDGWEKLCTNKQTDKQTDRHYENNGHLAVNQQQYLLHMSPQYGELRPTNGWDRLVSLGHPSKFQRVSRLGFVTAPTSLYGGQPNFARCLAVSWAGTLYRPIYFRGFLPLTEFCRVQNSICVVLRSFILSALLHGSRAVDVSQTLRRWDTELSLLVCSTYIRQGGQHVGHRPTF